MSHQNIHYRILIKPDTQTGTNKGGFTAYSPTLGVADDGDTVEEAISNVKNAIHAYIQSLIDDNEPIPRDSEEELLTSISLNLNLHGDSASNQTSTN